MLQWFIMIKVGNVPDNVFRIPYRYWYYFYSHDRTWKIKFPNYPYFLFQDMQDTENSYPSTSHFGGAEVHFLTSAHFQLEIVVEDRTNNFNEEDIKSTFDLLMDPSFSENTTMEFRMNERFLFANNFHALDLMKYNTINGINIRNRCIIRKNRIYVISARTQEFSPIQEAFVNSFDFML